MNNLDCIREQYEGLSSADCEAAITDLVLRQYRDAPIHLIPRVPWVLVRVLPSERFVGRLILPDRVNKPTLEAVVLAVWRNYVDTVNEWTDESGGIVKRQLVRKCELQVGDHVMFPKWAGTEAYELPKDKYRFVDADATQLTHHGAVLATIDYGEHDERTVLSACLADAIPDDAVRSATVERVMREFILIDRDEMAPTLKQMSEAG